MKTITDISIQKQKPKFLRLAPYCRVSSDSKDQLHSFAAQIRYYTEYAKRNPEYRLVDIYADEGITGTSMDKRDEMHRLLRDCKKGLIDRIIVKSVSRFARNTEELIATLRMLSEIGVSVYFEENGIDTNMINSEMIVTFPGIAAQQESLAISGNMRWSYKKRMESGDFNCTYPAYGFNLINGQLEINEDEAKTVRRIFAMYLQGIGAQTIANILNEESVPRRDNADRWYHGTVRYILDNERYMGDALLQKKYTTDTLPFKKMRNKGERTKYYVENSNPAVVSRETFKAAQELLKQRNTGTCRKNAVYPLSKIMVCPHCGRTFRRQIVKGTAYWLCSGKSSGATDCDSIRIKEAEVYEAFGMLTLKLTENREYLLGSLIRQIEEMRNRTSGNQQRIKEIDKELADLTAQNLLISKLHTKGVLNASDYASQSDSIGDKITELRIERRKRLAEDQDEELLDELNELNGIFAETIPSTVFDEELFSQIVTKITVNSNAELTFKLIGDIELTETIQEKGRCKTA